jgi:hypothetical protein
VCSCCAAKIALGAIVVPRKSKIARSRRSPSRIGPKRFPLCVISITQLSKVSFYP